MCTSQSTVGGPGWLADSRLRRITPTICHVYTLLPPDNGLLANPKRVEVQRLNKLKTVHVRFITRIFRDARSTKQNLPKVQSEPD
jgi:hypothetical protein